uniref:CSON015340 protein n=1 Tax=Culicoides sonorensis TaxID=179676 RepID=A0A336KTT6_CULSO
MGKTSNYVIQPRGKALYEDESSFGSRMLLKMGWTKGKGLGANLSGAQDFIRVRYKNDIGGLGYSSRDDQWTENEITYNDLLKNLNENQDTNDIKKDKQIESLEEKSKKSRARVHYQKFTRGKDLSRYSSKDLANIFGKKSLDESYKIEKEDEDISSSSTEPTKYEEDSKMINTGVSITDYFKSKREKLVKNTEIDKVDDSLLSQESEMPPKKKKLTKCDQESNLHLTKNGNLESNENLQVLNNEEVKQIPGDLEIKKSSKRKRKVDTETKSSEEIVKEETIKKRKKGENDDAKLTTTITVDVDPNKFFLDSVAVEKLKHLRLDKFKESNVANIVGYGLSKDVKLEICDSSIVKGISHLLKFSPTIAHTIVLLIHIHLETPQNQYKLSIIARAYLSVVD